MQGMADESQITTGAESRLFARAFIAAAEGSQTSADRVAIVVADIWSCTRRVKDGVLARLANDHADLYVEDNVLIAGTHTHSAPGGYSGNLLYDYDFTNGGCDEATVTCIVEGCVQAVKAAHGNLAPGRIFVNRGQVADCGRNRSEVAYLCNPEDERTRWGADTDREMLLLKFVKLGEDGSEGPAGALSWYPIHPTDRGQKNTLVTGDNKGYASALFEQQMEADHSAQETFVAAFANANCGDVSGNVELGHIPDGIHDRAQMEKHGRQQFEVARQLFAGASDEVTGPVAHRHTRVDLSDLRLGPAARTWPASLGASFAAGSSEDSVPVPDLGFHEGMTVANLDAGDDLISGLAGLGLSAIFGVSLVDEGTATTPREGQLPKPVVLMPGIESPSVAPQVLPVQLLRIGTVAVLGIPGELTTMAGRRLRETVVATLSPTGVDHVALSTYANEYSQYVTTLEEYGSQQYEGASTLFGPHTLEAYQRVAAELAGAIVTGDPVNPGPAPSQWTSPPQRRYRFRNLSSVPAKLKFFHAHDRIRLFTLPNGTKTIPGGAELAFHEREFTGPPFETVEEVQVVTSHQGRLMMSAGQLLTIATDGSMTVGDFTPRHSS
jgi:neutral ceramidase